MLWEKPRWGKGSRSAVGTVSLNRAVRIGLIEKATFEKRLAGSEGVKNEEM